MSKAARLSSTVRLRPSATLAISALKSVTPALLASARREPRREAEKTGRGPTRQGVLGDTRNRRLTLHLPPPLHSASQLHEGIRLSAPNRSRPRHRPSERRREARRRGRRTGLLLALAALALLLVGGFGGWLLAGRLPQPVQVSGAPPPVVTWETRLPRLEAPRPPAPRPLQPVAPPPLQTARGPAVSPATAAPTPDAAPTERPAWQRYAVLSPAAGARPRIAVVIDDIGPNRRNSEQAIQLGGPLTLAILPYADAAPALAAAARAHGHELLVHLPLEPEPGDRPLDLGPNALLVNLPAEERRRRLAWHLSRFDGYVGVNNHMGSRYTQQEGPMRELLEELHRRGLLFLDSRTTPQSVGLGLAQRLGLPSIGRDVFLDNRQTVPAVRKQLALVEQAARAHGHAIAIGHPYDETLEALKPWLAGLRERGFALVPVSALVAEGYRG